MKWYEITVFDCVILALLFIVGVLIGIWIG